MKTYQTIQLIPHTEKHQSNHIKKVIGLGLFLSGFAVHGLNIWLFDFGMDVLQYFGFGLFAFGFVLMMIGSQGESGYPEEECESFEYVTRLSNDFSTNPMYRNFAGNIYHDSNDYG